MPFHWRPFAALILTLPLAPAATLPPKINAVWVNSSSNAVTEGASRTTLIQSSVASFVNMLYPAIYSSTANSEGRLMYEYSDIAALVGAAHAQGIQVYAAYGDPTWPADGCSASANPMLRMADVIAYNAANPTAPLDGVMLDVEPSSPVDYVALLQLYQCLQQQVTSAGMGLGVAISAFWTDTVTFGTKTEPAYEQIVDLNLTSIVIMGYRNSAGTSNCSAGDGVVCLDEALIQYANSVNQANTVLVGLDTDNPTLDDVAADTTFFSMGQAAMDAAAQSVLSQFTAMNETFGGFAINTYTDSYLSGTVTGFPSTNPTVLMPVPTFGPVGVMNGASYATGSVAPGELISIFGDNLGPTAPAPVQVLNGKVGNSLGGVQVFFSGTPAPLFYSSAGQLTAIVPFEITAASTTVMQLVMNGNASIPVPLSTAAAAPGIFTANSSGTGQGAILNENYSINSASNPAAPGSIVVLYITGAGAMKPAATDGSTNSDAASLSQTAQTVTAEIGGMAATVVYAGSAEGIVSGVVQVNLVVPKGLSAGAQQVTVTIGGVTSPSGVTVAVG